MFDTVRVRQSLVSAADELFSYLSDFPLLQVLRKEMDLLRNNLLKAETVTQAAKKKFNEENNMLNELLSQFRAADDIRQEAYAHLQSLRKQQYDKVFVFPNCLLGLCSHSLSTHAHTDILWNMFYCSLYNVTFNGTCLRLLMHVFIVDKSCFQLYNAFICLLTSPLK